MAFIFERLSIPDVILIKPEIFSDNRGDFFETYKYSVFEKAGIKENFVQDNYSKSKKNVLRGLHYQKLPMAQSKIILCLKGKIMDVVVDIRKNSPTYAKWLKVELSEENYNMLYVPYYFAHGFLVLSDFAEVLYKCSKEYSPLHERGIIWNDPQINIEWPIKEPILSEKDKKNQSLEHCDNNFFY